MSALARVSPTSMTPLVGPGYRPVDTDERGLWQAFDRLEEDVAHSNMLVGDAALNSYVRGVVERLLGPQAADTRVYVVRDPDFNASMAPNGMMLVHTGLLARMRNEAQFAAVLGHESGHYLRRHGVRNWRDIKAKTATMSFLALAGAATGTWYALANAINSTLLLSLFQFSREMESEADAYGLKLMYESRYSARAASEVWSQIIEERKASAAARKKRYKDRATSLVSTHPPSAERMSDLSESAEELLANAPPDARYDDRRAEWLAAIAPHRAMLIEEQVKLNDSGASLYLINTLARDGWDGTLRYFEGEVYRLRDESGDAARAADAYAAAVAFADAPAQAYRAHGYAQLKAGNTEAGRRALSRYLELDPVAPDAAMVRFTLGQ
ncbi:MAG TPA: M48 family metallopeptidase [Steroidobacteraceae bacterium]|nr:M48 family metallopeptidase [Steroidobacteraceae bacterium]